MTPVQMIPMVLTMAGVTYLIRMAPFVCMRKKITSRYVQSLLYYLPYAVLAAMTFPEVFYIAVAPDAVATWQTVLPAVLGTAVALITAWFRRPLPLVAAFACTTVWIAELLITLF